MSDDDFNNLFNSYFSDYGNSSYLGDYEYGEYVPTYTYYDQQETSLQETWFPGYNQGLSDILWWFWSFLNDLDDYVESYGARLSLVGIVFNIFHITVLTRKQMFNNSINLIMVIIAINDIMGFILEICAKYEEFCKLFGIPYTEPSFESPCEPPNHLRFNLLRYVQYTMKRHFQRMAAWLAILMAGIRTLSMINAGNPDFPNLSTMKFGCYSLLIEFFSCAFVSSLTIYPYLFWYPIRNPDPMTQFMWEQNKKKCKGHANIEKQMEYQFYEPTEITHPIYVIDAISIKIIPCLCYPILTFLLVRALIKVKNSRKRLNQKNGSDHTTHLVIGMTVTFMIAEIPQAIGYIMNISDAPGINYIGTFLVYIFSYVSYLNSTIHCIISFLLSSLYRSTVYELLCIDKIKCKRGMVDVRMVTTHVDSGLKTTETRR